MTVCNGRLIIVLALIAVAGAFAQTARAGDGANVVSISSAQVDVGAQVSLASTVDLLPGVVLGAVTLQFDYDPQRIALVQCGPNPLLFVLCNEPIPGQIRASGIFAAGVSDDFLLLDLVFTALSPGETHIELTIEDFVDTANVPIVPVAAVGSVVTVSGELTDTDADGLADDADNCIFVVNPDQRDTNLDGIGNACDADLNNDCTVNVADLGLLRFSFFATGSALDEDFNGDGVVNIADLGVMRASFFSVFSESNPSGIANICTP